MKKFILMLMIAASSIASYANENVSVSVLNAFSKDFATAKNVEWTKTKNSFKASFELNEQHVMAFYTVNGELMGITRNISSLDLPITLQTDLKKNYDGYWISDLFEVSNSDGTNYYITIEKADQKVILESNLGAKWTLYKKATKA